MRTKIVVCALIAGLCLPWVASGQISQKAAPERSQIISAAKEVMGKARFCAFVTVGPKGQPQARVVDPFPPEDDLTVWVGTNPVTRKVAEIRKDPRVTLLYFDKETLGYVTVLGTAELVSDAGEKAKHWKDDWAGLYQDKYRGDDFVLLKVTPSRLEIVSYSHGLENDPQTLRPVVLELR